MAHRIKSDDPNEPLLWHVVGEVDCRYCRYSFETSVILTFPPSDDQPPPDQDCENCGRIGARFTSYEPVSSDIPDAEDSDDDPRLGDPNAP